MKKQPQENRKLNNLYFVAEVGKVQNEVSSNIKFMNNSKNLQQSCLLLCAGHFTALQEKHM